MRLPASFLLCLASAVLLAGCAASPGTTTSLAPSSATAVPTTAPPPPKAPAPPPPQVGTCDATVTSAGVDNQGASNGFHYPGCPLATAFPGGIGSARSLLVEVTWSALPATVQSLHCALQAVSNMGLTTKGEVATNDSMAPPARLVLEGKDLAANLDGLTGFVTVTGAALQQPFRFTFSAFQQEHVPGNYTAIPA
jgi:hypothetical protein